MPIAAQCQPREILSDMVVRAIRARRKWQLSAFSFYFKGVFHFSRKLTLPPHNTTSSGLAQQHAIESYSVPVRQIGSDVPLVSSICYLSPKWPSQIVTPSLPQRQNIQPLFRYAFRDLFLRGLSDVTLAPGSTISAVPL